MDKTKMFNAVLDVTKRCQYILTKFKGGYGWVNPEGKIASGAWSLYKTKTKARNDVLKRIKDLQLEFPNRKFELK